MNNDTKHFTSRRGSLLGVLGCAVLALGGWNDDGGCGTPSLTGDPGFDIWCGQKLCAWTTDTGKVRRVPTWHRSEYGASLEGDVVVISQVLSTSSQCLRFTLQADRDDAVSLQLEMDFLDDGTSEYSHALLSDGFKRLSYDISAPTWYKQVRVIVRKKGAGRAVLSLVRVDVGGTCTGPAMTMNDRPLGAGCDAPAQCKSGHCPTLRYRGFFNKDAAPGVCSTCSSDSQCPTGQACGVEGAPAFGKALRCVKAGTRIMGQRCQSDTECTSLSCCEGVCSQCCGKAGCLKGEVCEERSATAYSAVKDYLPLPWQCSPGLHAGAAKAPCLEDSDCTSRACEGAAELKVCWVGGRRCQQDADCPAFGCIKLGVAQGACK